MSRHTGPQGKPSPAARGLLSLTSGVCSSLDARFNLWDSVEPYAAQLLRDERGNIVQDVAQQALDAAGMALGLPNVWTGC